MSRKKPTIETVVLIARPIRRTAPKWWPAVQWVTVKYNAKNEYIEGWTAGIDITQRIPKDLVKQMARMFRSDMPDMKWEIAIASDAGEIVETVYCYKPRPLPKKKPPAKKARPAKRKS